MTQVPPEQSDADVADATTERATVMVVDDDQELADTYALWLADDYDVRTAYGGDDAIETFDDEVDVVLLDRRMPNVPGDEVLREIRAADSDCRVTMLTAVEPDTDIVDLPFDQYLVKPVTRIDLVETVEDLLLRGRVDEETREYLAMSATEETLESREADQLRDPEAVEELSARVERAGQHEEVQRQLEQLDRLRRTNRIIREVDQALVDSSARSEIEESVCTILTESGRYPFAWVGEYTRSYEQVTPTQSSDGTVAVGDTIDLADRADGDPVRSALETGAVQVVENGSLDFLRDSFDAAEVDGSVGEVAAVPIRYRETLYGALFVYAGESFTDEERSVLEELGDSIANAVNAVESKKLMFADTVVELEFDVTDESEVFVALSRDVGSRVALEGFIPTSNGHLTCYVTLSDASREDALATLAASEVVDHHRGVDETSDGLLLECTLSGTSAIRTLLDAGASVRTLVVEDGTAHVSAEVAPDVDVRTVAETLQSEFPDSQLVAKREAERSIQSTDSFRQSLSTRLTDRQRSVLEAAYTSGYFEWPRESTAEEVAEAIGLAPPTLHEHLRESQRKLVDTFLDEVE